MGEAKTGSGDADAADFGSNFAAALAAIAKWPLSDAEKAEALRRLLAQPR